MVHKRQRELSSKRTQTRRRAFTAPPSDHTPFHLTIDRGGQHELSKSIQGRESAMCSQRGAQLRAESLRRATFAEPDWLRWLVVSAPVGHEVKRGIGASFIIPKQQLSRLLRSQMPVPSDSLRDTRSFPVRQISLPHRNVPKSAVRRGRY